MRLAQILLAGLVVLGAGCSVQLADAGSLCTGLTLDPDGGGSRIVSSLGSFTPNSQRARSLDALIDGGVNPSSITVDIAVWEDGPLGCAWLADAGPLGALLQLYLFNRAAVPIGTGTYVLATSESFHMGGDGGLFDLIDFGFNVFASSGTVTLTQVQPTLVGTLEMRLADMTGRPLGIVCGSFDATICPYYP